MSLGQILRKHRVKLKLTTRAVEKAIKLGAGSLSNYERDLTNPLFKTFFNAAKQAGYPMTEDVNGFQQEGFGKFVNHI